MGASNDSIDFLQFLDVLRTSVSSKTGRILAQVGSVVGRTVDGVNAEWWQHVGFSSRPSKPIAGKASARSVAIRRGNVDAIVASEDDRGLELLGNLKEGETVLYGAGEDGKAQGRVLVKQDGSVNVYTTHDNTKEGSSVYLRVAPDGLSFVAPWGTLKFDATGFHVMTSSGATLNMGGMGGLPAPFDALSSYVKTTAGVIQQEASVQANGGAGGASLASAPAVISAIDALQTQVTAQAAAWAALGALTGPILGVMFQPIAAPLVAITTVGEIARVTAHATVPTTTTSA